MKLYLKERLVSQENLFYLILWVFAFVTPLVSAYFQTLRNPDFSFSFDVVKWEWRMFQIYGLLFIIHNAFVAPLLVYKKKKGLYLCLVFALFVSFFTYRYFNPVKRNNRFPKEWQHKPVNDSAGVPRFQQFEMDAPRMAPPPPRVGEWENRDPRMGLPIKFTMGNIIGSLVLLMLILGNLGAKIVFKSFNDEKLLQEKSKEHLKQQLEYLRYQINPHFLMNTLNNIHALVDIDAAKAQDMIVRLSKLFRFMLYEGNKDSVPLKAEMEFLRGYIELMSIRYSEDKVVVNFEESVSTVNGNIPPLLFVNFVENAFVHGVSYQKETFINVKLFAENEKVHFCCVNSKKRNDEPSSHGGVGVVNALKRLELLYGKKYSISKLETEETYSVELIVPFV